MALEHLLVQAALAATATAACAAILRRCWGLRFVVLCTIVAITWAIATALAIHVYTEAAWAWARSR